MLRHPAARAQFLRQTGYPHGRPGYVVDHIIPLECGGADSPTNMQWQTIAEAKAKDRTEENCRR
ncbi:MAG: HNH endonuclease [Acidobacteria bacterium]|nr:MAG: HNH endonuclease [Acidobacteriota bacterium]